MSAPMIEIDPNVRIQHNHTFVYLDEKPDLLATLRTGDAHVVFQPEMNVAWPATVVEVGDDGYVELDVAWSKWKPLADRSP